MSDDKTPQDSTEGVKDDQSVVVDDQKPEGEKDLSETFYPDDNKGDEGDGEKDDADSDDDKADDQDGDKSDDESGDDDDKSGDDDKDGDGDKDGDKGDYSLNKPENSRLSDADMERIASYAKDQGLSKEAAEKLVDNESKARDSYYESLQSEHKEMVKQWVEDVKSDKELGGEKFAESAELAKSVVARFGTDEFRKNLNESGYGNHPEVVRIFARIGRAMAPDTIVKENNPSGGARSLEEVFYGNN